MACRLHAADCCRGTWSSSSLGENPASPKPLVHSHHLSPTARLAPCKSQAWVRAAKPRGATAGAAVRLPSDRITAAPVHCLPTLPRGMCQPQRCTNQKYFALRNVILPKNHALGERQAVWSPTQEAGMEAASGSDAVVAPRCAAPPGSVTPGVTSRSLGKPTVMKAAKRPAVLPCCQLCLLGAGDPARHPGTPQPRDRRLGRGRFGRAGASRLCG